MDMDERSLRQAIDALNAWITQANEGDNIIDTLYEKIREDPNIFEKMDQIPFVDTPLHTAASGGHTHLAIEIMSLKPSFGKKLNPDGFSPVDLALQNRQHQTVRRLIEIDSDLLRVQGKGRITPLHYVAKTGDFHLLAEFLLACPASIHDLTIQRQTAVHIAVTNSRFAAFKVLLAWLQWEDKEYILSWKDGEGNTVLHIAAKTNQPQVARLLTNTVNVNAMNLMGLTALDLVDRLPNEEVMIDRLPSEEVMTTEITNILLHNKAKRVSSLAKVDSTVADIITLKWPFYPRCARTFFLAMERRLSSDMREIIVVVAVLIATATYQAALQPPGVLRRAEATDNNHPPFLNCTTLCNATTTTTTTPINEKSQLSHLVEKLAVGSISYVLFSFFNTIAFCASIGMLIVILEFGLQSILLIASLFFLCSSYFLAMEADTSTADPKTLVFQFMELLNWLFLLVLIGGRVFFLKGKDKFSNAILEKGWKDYPRRKL